jgi:hypothetical protein
LKFHQVSRKGCLARKDERKIEIYARKLMWKIVSQKKWNEHSEKKKPREKRTVMRYCNWHWNEM